MKAQQLHKSTIQLVTLATVAPTVLQNIFPLQQLTSSWNPSPPPSLGLGHAKCSNNFASKMQLKYFVWLLGPTGWVYNMDRICIAEKVIKMLHGRTLCALT